MGCKVKCMPLPKNIDFFNNVSANSSLSSTKASSCLRETGGREKKMRAKDDRKGLRAYRALTIFYCIEERASLVTETV